MILKRIDPFSCAKINGIITAIFGLIIGLFWSAGIMMMGAFARELGGDPEGLFTILFGVGAVIFLPILYGILGFIGGLIAAWLYNVIAGMIGGIEVEFEQAAAPPPSQPMQA